MEKHNVLLTVLLTVFLTSDETEALVEEVTEKREFPENAEKQMEEGSNDEKAAPVGEAPASKNLAPMQEPSEPKESLVQGEEEPVIGAPFAKKKRHHLRLPFTA